MNIIEIVNKIITLVVEFAPKAFGALVVLVCGWIAIGWLKNRLHMFFEHADFDEALETFLESFLAMVMRVILLVVVVSMLGVQTSSLVAVLGAASLAVGLALQGSLANFAGGVLILTFKPFKVGDYIEAQGVGGKVKKIEIFNTVLSTLDNKKVVLPNGNLSNDVIVNLTSAKKRRQEFVIGIGYGDDIPKAKEVIMKIITNHPDIIQDPEPTVGVSNLGASSVDLDVRFWVKTSDYLPMKYWFLEEVKRELDKAKISIPYPQMDVHINQ